MARKEIGEQNVVNDKMVAGVEPASNLWTRFRARQGLVFTK